MTPPRLELVPQGGERIFVVARTRLVVPGRPYVVAECSRAAFPETPGLERYDRRGMERDPSLRDALRSWRDEDDTLARRDASARSQLARSPRHFSPGELAARAMHPSMGGRRWSMGQRPSPA